MSEAKNVDKALELNENDFECHRMLSAVYLVTMTDLAEDRGKLLIWCCDPGFIRLRGSFGKSWKSGRV